jgi:hypothetical protein
MDFVPTGAQKAALRLWLSRALVWGLVICFGAFLKVQYNRVMGGHYANDPQCVLNEPIYKQRPCIKSGEWFPTSGGTR